MENKALNNTTFKGRVMIFTNVFNRNPVAALMRCTIWFSALASTGCTTVAGISSEIMSDMHSWIHAYREPANGVPSALVRISALGQFRLIPGRACFDRYQPGAGAVISSTMSLLNDTSHHGRIQGMKGEAPKGFVSAELRLPSGVPNTLVYDAIWGDGKLVYSCTSYRSFVPRAGAQYQVQAFVERPGRCVVELTSLDDAKTVSTDEAPMVCPG